MSEFRALASRVTALEVRLDEQARLRASQDRDLAGLEHIARAQHLTIQALAATQSEHNHKIEQVDHKVSRLDHKVSRLDHKVGQLDHKVGQLDHKVGQLDHKVERLDEKVELVNDGVRQIITLLSRASGGDTTTRG